MTDVSVTEHIAANPDTVYRMVSDVTRMGEWSPETTSCRWLDGATGPAPGARFRGSNRKGFRRWSTTCTVVDADPGRRFAFQVGYGPLPISQWSYDFAAADGGCTVTEGWIDRRPEWMRRAGPVVLGVTSQRDHNERNMRRTLATLKAAAESVREAAR